MGILTKTTIGSPSGRIGDLIFRTVYGKVQIYPYTKRKKISRSVQSLHCRSKFKITSKVCSAINKIKLVKAMWEGSPAPGNNSYCKLMSINYSNDLSEENISSVIAVPGIPSLNAVVNNINIIKNVLEFEIIITDAAYLISESFHPEITAQGVMMLQNPSVEMPETYEVIPLSSTHTRFQNNSTLIFKVPVVGQDLNLFESYSTKRFVLNLLLQNNMGGVDFFSENITGDLVF